MTEAARLSDAELDVIAERVARKLLLVLRPAANDARPPTDPAPPPAPMLTKAELAHALRRSTPTVDRWVSEGMPFVDMGTYKLFDIEACKTWVGARPKPGRPVKGAQLAPTPATLVGVELRTRTRRS